MTNIKLTQRDLDIIDFLKEFKICSTSTIERLFFPSQSSCEKRLAKLTDARKIARTRDNILSEYLYYIPNAKPSNIKHSLIIADVYSKIATTEKVLKYKREYEIKHRAEVLRADLMLVIQGEKGVTPLLVEIDLTKAYNEKYTQYITSGYYKQLFPIAPQIICISNRTPKTSISVQWYKLNEI